MIQGRLLYQGFGLGKREPYAFGLQARDFLLVKGASNQIDKGQTIQLLRAGQTRALRFRPGYMTSYWSGGNQSKMMYSRTDYYSFGLGCDSENVNLTYLVTNVPMVWLVLPYPSFCVSILQLVFDVNQSTNQQQMIPFLFC